VAPVALTKTSVVTMRRAIEAAGRILTLFSSARFRPTGEEILRNLGAGAANTRRLGRGSQCPGLSNFCSFLHPLWQAPSVRETLRSSAQGPVRSPTSEPSRPHASRPDRPVVLVVDDDTAVRDALRLVLDEEYTVMEAAHGRTALTLVLAQRVDVVLLDILMPDVDGLEILQELKALAPDLPI